MLPRSLLVANRGEIAIRIMRAAAELGIRTVAVFSEDDARSLHTRKADEARALTGIGAAAYLDIEQIVAVAKAAGCDAIHPGYGFLSENASFARRAAEAGVTFVGPRPEMLELFGDKVRARELAERLGVPLLPGTAGATSLSEAREFLASLGDGGAMMIKAVAGGGGRGMRAVSRLDELEEAYRRCQSEARAAFGNRRRVRRAADAAGAPYRGPDSGRRFRQRQPSVGARMHHPAAQSEAGRDRAQSRTRPSACAPASPRRPCAWPRRFATTALARSSFWSTPTRGTTTPGSPSSRPTRACRSSTR